MAHGSFKCSKYSRWMNMSHTLNGIIWKDEWILRWRGLIKAGRKVANILAFTSWQYYHSCECVTAHFHTSPHSHYKMKSSKSTLSRVMKQIDFALGGLSSQSFCRYFSSSRIEARNILKDWSSKFYRSISAPNCFFLKQRWSYISLSPYLFFSSLYTNIYGFTKSCNFYASKLPVKVMFISLCYHCLSS